MGQLKAASRTNIGSGVKSAAPEKRNGFLARQSGIAKGILKLLQNGGQKSTQEVP